MSAWHNGGFPSGAAPGGSNQIPTNDDDLYNNQFTMGSPYSGSMPFQGSPYQPEQPNFVGPPAIVYGQQQPPQQVFQPIPQPVPQQRQQKKFFGLWNLSIPPPQPQAPVYANGESNTPNFSATSPSNHYPMNGNNRNIDSLSPIPGAASAADSPAAFSNASGEDGKPKRNTSKRTGRPPIWDPKKTRQLIRNYLWSPSKLPRTLQFFHQDDHPDKDPLSDDAAKRQQNGAQKKLNQTIAKDPRSLKGNEKDLNLLNWRVNLPARSQRHIARTTPAPQPELGPDRQHTMMSIKMGAVTRSFSGLSINSRKAFSLLKNLTIKSEPDSMISRQVTVIDPVLENEVAHDDDTYVPLPGDLLLLDSHVGNANYNLTPEPEHQTLSYDLIWAEMRDEPSLWVNPSGLAPRAKAVLVDLANNPMAVDLMQTDCFGNTILHLLASRKDLQNRLLGLFDKATVSFAALSAKNTAQQTFLHVLAREWFELSGNNDAPIFKLLHKVEFVDANNQVVNELTAIRDVYGQTVFHRIKICVPEPGASDMIQAIRAAFVCEKDEEYLRDAFGSLVVEPAEPLPQPLAQEQQITVLVSEPVAQNQEGLRYRPYSAMTPGADLNSHIVARAHDDKHVEDGMGNGPLHCLAALAGIAQPGRKRKASEPLDPGRSPGGPMGNANGRSRDTTPGEAMGSPGSPAGANMPVPEDPMAEICRRAETLLASGCSISHYDRQGRTALMAFIEHLPADSLKIPILKIVVDAAKKEDMLEARSREGETALLLAARLGKIAAVRELTAAGANQFVRASRHGEARGVLRSILHEQAKHKHDTPGLDGPWGRLEASLKVLAGQEREGIVGGQGQNLSSTSKVGEPKLVRFPDVIDEWGLVQ